MRLNTLVPATVVLGYHFSHALAESTITGSATDGDSNSDGKATPTSTCTTSPSSRSYSPGRSSAASIASKHQECSQECFGVGGAQLHHLTTATGPLTGRAAETVFVDRDSPVSQTGFVEIADVMRASALDSDLEHLVEVAIVEQPVPAD